MSSSEWKEILLGDYINVKHGYAFKGEFFSETETEDILVTPGNFNIGGGFKEDKLKFYNGEYPKEYVLKPNDIIVTMTDLSKMGDTLGYSALVPNNAKRRYLHNQRVGLVEFISQEVFPSFIYWRLRSNAYQQFIVGSASGTTVKHTSPKTIRSFRLNLPLLPEQKAIADTLSCLDDKIELNNRINKTLEEMAQAIFKSWFVDFEPFQDGEFEDSELGRIPKGWRVGTLEEISGDIICGKTPPTKDKENYGDLMPFITIPDMHGNIYVTKTERYLSQKGMDTQSNKTLPKNSVVVSCIATPGLVILTSENSQTNQQINSIICKEGISCFYIFLCMKNYSSKIRDLGSGGSTTLNLNKTQFSKIKLILPSKQILIDFHQLLEPLFTMILENQIESQILIAIRDSLLPKLMSGEIRVPIEEVQ